ncbi:probable glucan endo-1,3-beta-glucosidase BG5 [Malania oleifera]|uniref:probable glucan endo-1,3-beta-glucosidase BG5 n=1 Tax=Malania oleifera TaxID=397392 RepID=UPI0025ADB981|nr:probable glucan endo-1,3-beta-glucosidase BG5 [Malania oleifera]
MALYWIALALLAMHNLPPTTSIDIGLCFLRRENDTHLSTQPLAIGLLQQYKIEKVRIYDSDPWFLYSASNSSISVLVTIRNDDLIPIAYSQANATAWFNDNLQPYIDFILFPFIIAGNDAIPGPYAVYVRPALDNLQQVLTANGLSGMRVSTAVSTKALRQSYFPPSIATFSDSAVKHMTDVVAFLEKYSSPLLLNVYPYFEVAKQPKREWLDFALFRSKDAVVKDGNLEYDNLLDYMVDAFRCAMEKVGSTTLDVVVAETGWPSAGNGDLTTPELAGTYNGNFMKHVLSLAGSPKRPGTYLEGYIYEMYNDEGHDFGVFYRNRSLVAPIF